MPDDKRRILVIGEGPALLGNDGTGDARMTAALSTLRERGHDVVLVTANPATTASDPMRAARTYLEPLDELALRAIVSKERPALVLAELGGERAVALANALEKDGTLASAGALLVTVEGLSVAAAASDETASHPVLILGPGPSRIDSELEVCAREAVEAAREAGHAALLIGADDARDAASVLAVRDRVGATRVIVQAGGEHALAMAAELAAGGLTVLGTKPEALARAHAAAATPPHAVSLDDAIAVSVDAVSDGKRVVIAGLLEHLEPPFVHVGDAAAILPAFTLNPEVVARIEDRVRALALDLGIVGLLGARVAVVDNEIIVLDVEPRAGLTTAFVTRATGFPLMRIATQVMFGATLDDLGVTQPALPRHVAARERVFPREREGGDPVLGAAMRSTGEAIGIDDTPARAYAKALRGVGISMSGLSGAATGSVLFSVSERDNAAAIELARRFRSLGFDIVATGPTAGAIGKARIAVTAPLAELADDVRAGRIRFAIVTARGDSEIAATRPLRSACLSAHVPCFTTMRLARLGCSALEEAPAPRIRTLQDWYADA